MLIITVAFLAVLGALMAASLRIVQPGYKAVRLHLGQIVSEIGEGRVIVIPWVQRLVVVDCRVAPPTPVQFSAQLRGGVNITCTANVVHQVVDTIAFVKNVKDDTAEGLARTRALTAIRKALGETHREFVPEQRGLIETLVNEELAQAVTQWGLEIRVFLDDLAQPKGVARALRDREKVQVARDTQRERAGMMADTGVIAERASLDITRMKGVAIHDVDVIQKAGRGAAIRAYLQNLFRGPGHEEGEMRAAWPVNDLAHPRAQQLPGCNDTDMLGPSTGPTDV